VRADRLHAARLAARFALPPAVSLAAHLAILAVLVSVASAITPRPPVAPGTAVATIRLDPPRPEESRRVLEPSPEPPEFDQSVRAPGVSVEAPVLESSAFVDASTPLAREGETVAGAGRSPGALSPADAPPPIGAAFAGLRARRAASVVFVVDASGSMVTSLPLVLADLSRSIAALTPRQRFQVVLFREPVSGGGARTEMFGIEGMGLVRARARTRADVSAWLGSVAAGGRSNPMDGLRAALALRPDVVFVLARSYRRGGGAEEAQWGAPLAGVLAELDRLNPRTAATGARRTVIKAIQFIDDDPSGVLRAIAEAHGDGEGSYRVLTLEEIARR
jgi:hypothetical protein